MRRRRTALVISLAVILLLGLATGVAALAGWGPFEASTAEADPVPAPAPSVDVPEPETTATTAPPPASPEPEATSTESAPADPVGPTPDPTDAPADVTPPPGTDEASVLITYASWEDSTSSVEVGAYAALVEPAATCTLTLTRGSETTSQTIDALSDVSTMSCGGFQVGKPQVAPGTWTAVVTYDSATSSGTSAPVEVIVP